MDGQVEFEKERKFLPGSREFWTDETDRVEKCLYITQGYLLIDPVRGISRVRINSDSEGKFIDARLEVKLHATDEGAPELPPAYLTEEVAIQCLGLAKGGAIAKFRHYVRYGELLFHVDQFVGRHAPLVIIELEHENPASITRDMLPPWVGDEVSGDPQYNNVAIAQR